MTYDGVPEDIVYEVYGTSWDQPISWSFTIFNGGQEAFLHVVENDDNSVNFEDTGYVDNCTGLVDCRKEWFLNQAFKTMIHTVPLNEAQRHGDILRMFKIQAPKFYVKQLNLTEKQATDSVNRLAEFLKVRDIVGVSMPESFVHFGTLMTYDTFHKKFVHLYQP